jgi:serine-type D-Ala-D-Ala carboxypeptidase/endopeptidase (penicillin-binding protein 4)
VIKKQGITLVDGTIIVQQSFSAQAIPDGWIWQDIGNYYGAGAQQLNWRENQYDLILKSGNNIDDAVEIADIKNGEPAKQYQSYATAAAKGTGDNAYIYLPRKANGVVTVDGTIPAGENNFSISGAVQNPEVILFSDMTKRFDKHAIRLAAPRKKWTEWMFEKDTLLDTYYSPPLDSINYWFMRRSINLYGEALVKAIAFEKKIRPGTDEGVRLVRDFWEQQGIERSAINIIDGSGLSPQNRVTADALVKALLFAKTRPWFASFYESIPTFNGRKLKSGSIGGARAFAGYHKDYVVAIIVNNYAGPASEMVKKLYAVLDQIK